MINLLISIQFFFINLQKTTATIVKFIVLSKKTTFKNQNHDKKEAIILGNGPSLKKMITAHSAFMEQKDVVCVNYFPTSDLYEKIKPKYLISSAVELYLEDLDDPSINHSNELFNQINEKTTWPLAFFFPFAARKYNRWQKIIDGNKNISVHYYNKTPIEGFKSFKKWSFNKKLGMARPQNVLIPCISIMIWLGYKKIYLWGADHSWLKEISVDENNNALVNQKHFYDEGETKPETMKKGGKGKRKLHEILYKFMISFREYFDILDYAKDNNAEILNCTKGSFIDAFDRLNLDKITPPKTKD